MRIGLISIVLGTVLLGAVVVPFTREFFAVDACLDGGGSFDYAVGMCDHQKNHPFVPFTARHQAATPTGVTGTVLVLVGLFVWKRHP
jgi:hypothetical protein